MVISLLMASVGAPQSGLPQYLTFVTTLIWQLIIVSLLIGYRRQIGDFLNRISKLKAFGVEFEKFQPVAKDAPAPTPRVVDELERAEPNRFLSGSEVKHLVDNDGLNEKAFGSVRVLSNKHQQGWLVGTKGSLLYLLDTPGTRISGRVIQWRLPFSQTQPVVVHPANGPVGKFDVGKKKNWLYSARMHSDPDQLQREILELITPPSIASDESR